MQASKWLAMISLLANYNVNICQHFKKISMQFSCHLVNLLSHQNGIDLFCIILPEKKNNQTLLFYLTYSLIYQHFNINGDHLWFLRISSDLNIWELGYPSPKVDSTFNFTPKFKLSCSYLVGNILPNSFCFQPRLLVNTVATFTWCKLKIYIYLQTIFELKKMNLTLLMKKSKIQLM